MIKLAVGYLPNKNLECDKEQLSLIESEFGDYIHDLHFSHYDHTLVASGRDVITSKETLFNFIKYVHENHKFRLTLLMNYLLHDDYQKVIDNFREEFYPLGIRSVVIADLNLIKLMKKEFPDVLIQGSCLSYRITSEQLEEERIAGVEIHNPGVDIIRDTENLIRNHKNGYIQKVIFGEGCMHKCPFEKIKNGHRESIAKKLPYDPENSCVKYVLSDMRHFFRSNWVTIERLKQLEPYIDIIKLPRGSHESFLNTGKHPVYSLIKTFINIYENNLSYNIMNFNAVMYKSLLLKHFKTIDSSIFKNEFFDQIEKCDMKCSERNCHICHNAMKTLNKQNNKPDNDKLFNILN